jgi:hypothetical protein
MVWGFTAFAGQAGALRFLLDLSFTTPLLDQAWKKNGNGKACHQL